LALSLLEEGITAMKIWPFDIAAEKSKGWSIGTEDLKSALQPFEKIRRAVGDRMDIMVEFHSLWQLMPAIDIARALAPYRTFWHEDPIRMDALDDLRRYARESRAPVCASETLATRFRFRDLLATEAAGVVMLDVGWCGGLSEAKKIATMAEAWKLPVAPHDCTGPIGLIAGTHLSLNAPNALIQESVRAYYRTWYRDIVTELPTVSNGMISVSDAPGLGTELHPELDKRFTVHRRTSR
jgi:L-alanine-DL-glutamate epimerase-like enolase superfamily enzyme